MLCAAEGKTYLLDFTVFARHCTVNRYVKVNCVYSRFIHPEDEHRCVLWNHFHLISANSSCNSQKCQKWATSQGQISVSSFIHPPQVTANKLLSPPSKLEVIWGDLWAFCSHVLEYFCQDVRMSTAMFVTVKMDTIDGLSAHLLLCF